MPRKHDVIKHDLGLIGAAAETLRAYGLTIHIEGAKAKIPGTQVDALLRVQKGTHERLFLVEAKDAPTNATVAQLIERRVPGHGFLLVAPHIPPPLADQLREKRIPFVDTAGNAWIHTPEFLIWVTGRKPATKLQRPVLARAFAIGGLQLTFTLLTNPDWVGLPTRELAKRAGVANGTAAAALRDLETQGYVLRLKKRGARRLRNTTTLLNKWTEGYLQRLQPAIELGTYAQPEKGHEWWRTIDLDGRGALLGGEAAAALLTGFLTPGAITLYTDQQPANLIADLKLRRDKNGTLVVRRKFWRFELPEINPQVTPPLLVYADLIGTNDARCIEAAGKVKDKYLARLLQD